MTDTWESTPLVAEVWESNTTPGVEWRTVYSEPSEGADLSDAVPQALGTAGAGVATTASRADHVHAMPTAAQVGAAATSHTQAISTVTGLQAALDGKAPGGHELDLIPGVGPYLLGIDAVDGTATEVTLYTVDAAIVNDSTSLPDGVTPLLTVPISALDAAVDATKIVAVVAGAHVGVYQLEPGEVTSPWTELPTPLGSYAGFYVSDAVRLLMARTAYGWITIDPIQNITAVELPYLSGSAWHTAQDAIEALESDDLCLLLDGTAGGWSTPNLGDTPDGIDIRMKFLLRRPTNHGVQKYMELLTQPNPGNTGGDNWELAGQWSDGDEGGVPDVLELFWEHTELGATGETPRFHDVGLRAGEWATVRVTVDTANSTTSFYREVAYNGDATAGGREWRLLKSWVYDEAGSMDTGVTNDWEIGLRALGQVAWLEVAEFGAAGLLIDLKPSHMLTAGVGATSVTDGEGNVWTAGGSCEVGYVNPLGARLAAIEAAL